ncbi:MAG: MerR family transcriptional regulator, thiopeptide resistance regulator, partial [Mycobacterium sp.]|nr:MerR family transcriptional regulator, thiopeptide resistance regulator [Mycobacterium sp.]
ACTGKSLPVRVARSQKFGGVTTVLLRPDRLGANGYRYYEREQLLRLQEVLLLRELGMGLATIGSIVDDEDDPTDALRRHHRRLLEDRERLVRLAATVTATIQHLEEGTDMPAETSSTAEVCWRADVQELLATARRRR